MITGFMPGGVSFFLGFRIGRIGFHVSNASFIALPYDREWSHAAKGCCKQCRKQASHVLFTPVGAST